MDPVPVPLNESGPTSVTELENALLVLRKTLDEVAGMKAGLQKAQVVSGLYRALQELTKEVRKMRDYALLDAAVEQAKEHHQGHFFEFDDDVDASMASHALNLAFYTFGLRANQTFQVQDATGKMQMLYAFGADYEPIRIVKRLRQRIIQRLRHQREWEAQYGRPHPHPSYQNYANH